MESKCIDRPWKLFLWIIVIDRVLKFPVRFVSDWFTAETFYVVALISFLAFVISVTVVGFLYSSSGSKTLGKKLRFRTALYVSVFSLLMGLFVVIITAGFFGIFDVIITAAVNFALVYYLLVLGFKIHKKV